MSRVLVVQNTPRGGPGRLGDWLTDAGSRVQVVRGHAGEPPPERLDHDALVVMGGGFMPDDDTRAPWLRAVRALTRQALRRSVPYLGICLGGQLLAQVAGGTVEASHGAPEVGSTTLTLRPEAAADPLFHGLPETVTAIERHVDAITALPPGARWLAESPRCPYQAFRYGRRAWGVQFHPEATAGQVGKWDRDWIRDRGFDPERVVRRATEDEAAATEIWRRVADRFGSVVRGS